MQPSSYEKKGVKCFGYLNSKYVFKHVIHHLPKIILVMACDV